MLPPGVGDDEGGLGIGVLDRPDLDPRAVAEFDSVGLDRRALEHGGARVQLPENRRGER